MAGFWGMISFLIFIIIFCVFGFERAMWSCVGFWTERQYKLWKLICGAIGGCFLFAIILVCVLSPDRFSSEMNKVTLVLVFSAFFTMGVFSQVIHLVAWKKKNDILKYNIKEMLKENETTKDKKRLLDICLNENRANFTEKQIERIFKKITNEQSELTYRKMHE